MVSEGRGMKKNAARRHVSNRSSYGHRGLQNQVEVSGRREQYFKAKKKSVVVRKTIVGLGYGVARFFAEFHMSHAGISVLGSTVKSRDTARGKAGRLLLLLSGLLMTDDPPSFHNREYDEVEGM